MIHWSFVFSRTCRTERRGFSPENRSLFAFFCITVDSKKYQSAAIFFLPMSFIAHFFHPQPLFPSGTQFYKKKASLQGNSLYQWLLRFLFFFSRNSSRDDDGLAITEILVMLKNTNFFVWWILQMVRKKSKENNLWYFFQSSIFMWIYLVCV